MFLSVTVLITSLSLTLNKYFVKRWMTWHWRLDQWRFILWWRIQHSESWLNTVSDFPQVILLPWWWTCMVPPFLLPCKNNTNAGKTIFGFGNLMFLKSNNSLVLKVCRLCNRFGSGATWDMWTMTHMSAMNNGGRIIFLRYQHCLLKKEGSVGN